MKYDFTALTNLWYLDDNPQILTGMRGYSTGQKLARAYEGSINAASVADVPDQAFVLLNRDDRPNGQYAPSLSVGDVVVVHTPDGDVSYACEPIGWKEIETPDYENVDEYLIAVERHSPAELETLTDG